jgi:DNA polymerase-3 subunit epsilon
VFTGALAVTRVEAAAIASDAGCEIDEGITKRTTILVVGDQDLRQLAGYTKSAKHRKAEQLVAKGQHIRILFERDFYSTVAPQSAQVAARQRRDSHG